MVFTGDIYDASSTIFADDITKRTVTNTPQEVFTKMRETSTVSKKFAAGGFVVPGSVTSMKEHVARRVEGEVVREDRDEM